MRSPQVRYEISISRASPACAASTAGHFTVNGRAELAANVVRQDGAPAAQVWCRTLGGASAVKAPYPSALTGRCGADAVW
ncbi:hypothetical protein JKG47_12725 [Acidithiobacillus sp. MC6.1]|nr:hypothetical protein [Acidithiobacillus sp. MC6.1]